MKAPRQSFPSPSGDPLLAPLQDSATCSNSVLLFGSLCILVIGIGIIKGRQEFVGEEAAA